ncbi:hypothetical protein [Ravibacter arvi]
MIRRSVNEPGKKGRDRELYFDLSFDGSTVSNTLKIGDSVLDIKREEMESLYHSKLIGKGRERDFAVDNEFCSECEKSFEYIEDLYSSEVVGEVEKKSKNHFQGVLEILITDRYRINLFYAFHFLNIWRYSIFNYDSALFSKKLIPIKQYLMEILTSDKDKLDQNLKKSIELTAFIAVFILKVGGERDGEDIINEKFTNSLFFHSLDEPRFFVFGTTIILLHSRQSYFKTRTKPYYGLSSICNLFDASSNCDVVKIEVLGDDHTSTFMTNCAIEISGIIKEELIRKVKLMYSAAVSIGVGIKYTKIKGEFIVNKFIENNPSYLWDNLPALYVSRELALLIESNESILSDSDSRR